MALSAVARASRNPVRSTSRWHQAVCTSEAALAPVISGGIRWMIRSIAASAAAVEAAHGDGRQQAQRLSRLACLEPVLDRRHPVGHALEPTGRAGVLLPQSLGRPPRELGEQRPTHQAVHLEPPTGVEAGDEQSPRLGLQQEIPGIGSSGQGFRQPVVHPINHGGREEEVDQLGGLRLQYLVPQVAVDQPVGADLTGRALRRRGVRSASSARRVPRAGSRRPILPTKRQPP